MREGGRERRGGGVGVVIEELRKREFESGQMCNLKFLDKKGGKKLTLDLCIGLKR